LLTGGILNNKELQGEKKERDEEDADARESCLCLSMVVRLIFNLSASFYADPEENIFST